MRAFVNRDWNAVAANKTSYWADRFRAQGHQPAWDAANALLADMRRVRLDYPTTDSRADDLHAHVRVCTALTRAAHALACRATPR